ncbi:Peroxisomal membrane protein PMP47B [Ceratocystis fimbriata CBS 114723]|uniref:Peroxisomal membrane protein PMP47B n=1 Tax=Ceratocystis fimbriata CBS 114723 TaxID=1035309 RepID=A0A2C5X1H8_9PEZI|nr:Peroxisomal membrane protein PMP47B [Ceratocystis fimbriata CBS 114723]
MAASSKPVQLAPVPPNDNVAHALAGSGGGLLSMALTYPLVTLSTRAQVDSRKAESTFMDAAKKIIAREGFGGLYSGLNSALFGISVTNFVYYFWYEWSKSLFENAAVKAGRHSRRLTAGESILAGAFAGSATVIITNPIWVVNTRVTTRNSVESSKPAPKLLSTDPETAVSSSEVTATTDEATAPRQPSPAPRAKSGAGAIKTLLALLKHEGPSALFAGVVPALVLVINPILQYTLFEQLKNMLERRTVKVSPAIAFYLGALTKLFATSITYPYITVKAQMHVAQNKDEGVFAAFRRVVKGEGYGGLYKGIGAKLLQSVMTAAFLFAFKDVLYEHIARARKNRAIKA